MNYTLKEFLRLLHNKEPICFVKNKKIIKFSKATKYNGVKELHYIPNTGGTKDEDIKQFNAYFIDLDSGKDKHDNFFDLDVVSRYRKQKLKELQRFQPSPSTIVQTRNGFQVLWFIKDAPTPSQWRCIENYLVDKFDADKNVKNPSKQMRLPCPVWMKEKDIREQRFIERCITTIRTRTNKYYRKNLYA